MSRIYITDFPRSAPRCLWRWYWRTMRVIARESEKAVLDSMLYGRGFVKIPNDGSDPQHIPIQQMHDVL